VRNNINSIHQHIANPPAKSDDFASPFTQGGLFVFCLYEVRNFPKFHRTQNCNAPVTEKSPVLPPLCKGRKVRQVAQEGLSYFPIFSLCKQENAAQTVIALRKSAKQAQHRRRGAGRRPARKGWAGGN